MIVELFTTDCKSTGVFGILFIDSSTGELSTLEHAYLQPDGSYASKLRPGKYTCVRGQHQLHSGPIETFEITNVPGHTGILFHYGNKQEDSDGCVLIGTMRMDDVIVQSRAAFAKFMDALKDVDTFTLVVT